MGLEVAVSGVAGVDDNDSSGFPALVLAPTPKYREPSSRLEVQLEAC